MTCILVATDGSEGADRAVDYAAHLAKKEGMELLIVNVIGGYGVPDSVFRGFTRAEQTWLREQLESVSNHILNAARERARGVGAAMVFLESRTGDVANTIIEIAQEKDVETIVVGKRGVGRIAALLLGSVSQKIVSLAPKPVTVVP
ncbi:MAG: universal stress protein [Pseudolabrys sp.]|jgi:nucleotide-binding universal stress UspA family protein